MQKNEAGHFELNGVELRSGARMHLLIEGYWIEGHFERWNEGHYWFSRRDGVAVALHPGLFVRLSGECTRV